MWQVIYYKLAPDFVDRYEAHMIQEARASGESEASINRKIADLQRYAAMYKNPAINAAIAFLEPLPVGAGHRARVRGDPAAQERIVAGQ